MPTKPRIHRSHTLTSSHNPRGLSSAQKIRGTYKWTKHSQRMRDIYPLCQWPDGCEEPSRSTHHIEPLHIRPELAFLESNTIPLCTEHHDWCNVQEAMGHSTHYKFVLWRELIDNREIIDG